VQEKANHSMRYQFPHHLWHEQEMVIVHPNCVSSFVLTYDSFRKCSVDRDILLPSFFLPNPVLGIIWNLVVECRPENLFAISIIVAFQFGVRDEHWNRLFVAGKVRADFRFLGLAQCVRGLHQQSRRGNTMPRVPTQV
jgi:hypothetical protein